jgi:hypothetical protein
MLTMKKTVIIGLVVVLVLGLGAMSFADSTFERGFGQFGRANENFEPGYGRSLSDEEFDALRASHMQQLNLSLMLESSDAAVETLAELTDLSIDDIKASDLTLHELAVQEDVLDKCHAAMLATKKATLDTLVEEGTITQAKADFMLERMSQMNGDQERLGQTVEKGMGRGFGRKR